MTTVADILARKGSTVYTVAPDATVYEAIKKMVEKKVGALLVLRDAELVGIITERDYLREVILKDRTSVNTRVASIMSTRLVCVDPGTRLAECMAIMTEKRFRHLPVMQGRDLVGLVSVGDIVKHLSAEQAFQIRYLTDYIKGTYPG